MRHITIKDIAKELGISKSTVSRALSGDSQNVSHDTIRKVLETAERMGYRKNEMAVNLRHRSTKTIGIILPEAETSYYMKFTAIVQHLLQLKGYRLLLAISDEDFLNERSNVELFDKYRVDGLLISTCHNKANYDFYESFLKNGIPIVFFDRIIPGLDCSWVKSDDYKSAFFLMEHLIYDGRKRILFMSAPDYISTTADRMRAYNDTLSKHHIPYDPSLVLITGTNEDDGAKAMEKFLEDRPGNEMCDALFCFTDLQAVGAKKVLESRGIAIPQTISIACMSGTRMAALVSPAITTVERPMHTMAQEAVRLLLAKIGDSGTPPEKIVLPAEMFIRGSTK
ncbi:MAG: LacI family DNA-binding transcriptional regulator [Candidatus Cryptobacteroides sp.]